MICYEDIQKMYKDSNIEVNAFDKFGVLVSNPRWLIVNINVDGVDKKVPDLPYGGFARITEDTLLYAVSRTLGITLARIDSFMKKHDVVVYFYLPHTNECFYLEWRENAIGERSWRSTKHSGDCCIKSYRR